MTFHALSSKDEFYDDLRLLPFTTISLPRVFLVRLDGDFSILPYTTLLSHETIGPQLNVISGS